MLTIEYIYDCENITINSFGCELWRYVTIEFKSIQYSNLSENLSFCNVTLWGSIWTPKTPTGSQGYFKCGLTEILCKNPSVDQAWIFVNLYWTYQTLNWFDFVWHGHGQVGIRPDRIGFYRPNNHSIYIMTVSS